MELIDKEKLIDEINKRLSICNKVALDLRNVENKDYYQGKAESYKETLDLLNTLEVKEMDSTDAFIDKACKWLEENAGSYLLYPFCEYDKGALLEDFKKDIGL